MKDISIETMRFNLVIEYLLISTETSVLDSIEFRDYRFQSRNRVSSNFNLMPFDLTPCHDLRVSIS